jgi:hypothetical protein
MIKFILKKDGKVLGSFDNKEEAQDYVIEKAEEGEDVFSYTVSEEEVKDIRCKVKTYEDACSILGVEPINEEELKANGFREDEIARRKLEAITEALNEGWKPSWNDTEEYKYYPWFYIEPNKHYGAAAGLSCAYTSYAASAAYAYIGSRLCFKTSKLAKHAADTFTELYEKILVETF